MLAATIMIVTYETAVELPMKDFYDSLLEKDRLRYAAIEAHKLDRSGIGGV